LVGEEVRHLVVNKVEMKSGARRGVEQGPLHSNRTPDSETKLWEGSMWRNVDVNMGEDTVGRNFERERENRKWEVL
jgi:hypothetical protein